MPEMQNILIVDDDPDWRRFLADTLSEHYAVPLAFWTASECSLCV